MKKLIVTIAAVIGLAAPLAAVTAASASTPGCSATAYCGSQQVQPGNRNQLMMAVTNKPGIGSAVTVKLAGTTSAQEDFLQYNPPNPASNSKVFKYAPDGLTATGKGYRAGLCVTAASGNVRAAVVLEPCSNAASQQWIYTTEATGGTWRLRGSSYVLTDPNGGPVYTRLQLRNDWDGPNQQWTYVAAPAG